MARVDNLGHFLTDVADAIRTKAGTSDTITASDFDTAISNIPSGADLNEYFTSSIPNNSSSTSNLVSQIIKRIPADISVSGTNLSYAFSRCNNLIEIPPLDTSKVTNMTCVFENCSSLTEVPPLDMSRVTNAAGMFQGCSNLSTLPTLLNTNNLPNVANLFYNCHSLETAIVNYNLSNVTNYNSLFNGCNKLKRIEFNNTINTSLTISSAMYMFYYCVKAEYIDLRYFDLTKIQNKTNMFGTSSSDGVPNNCEIIVADQTQKDWMNTNFSRLTNVKTVAEYEAE